MHGEEDQVDYSNRVVGRQLGMETQEAQRLGLGTVIAFAASSPNPTTSHDEKTSVTHSNESYPSLRAIRDDDYSFTSQFYWVLWNWAGWNVCTE